MAISRLNTQKFFKVENMWTKMSIISIKNRKSSLKSKFNIYDYIKDKWIKLIKYKGCYTWF